MCLEEWCFRDDPCQEHPSDEKVVSEPNKVFDEDEPESEPDFWFFAGDDSPISNEPFGLNCRFAAGAAWKSLF